MSAALAALRNHGVCAEILQVLCKNRCRNNRHDVNSGLLPFIHVLARISRAGGDELHAGFCNNFRKLICLRMHQHQIHRKGFVRKLPADLNFLPQLLRIHPAASDRSESSRLRAGRRKGTGRNVGHSALDHRISGSKNFIQHFHFYSLFPVLRAGETRHPSGKSRLPR